LRIKKFLNHLKSQKNISDWQLKQADDVIRLYVNHFLNGEISLLSPNQSQKGFLNVSKILSDMRKAIRIKHYSYRTEQTYIDWAKRFFDYAASVKRRTFKQQG